MSSNTKHRFEQCPIAGVLAERCDESRYSAVESLMLADDYLFEQADLAEAEALDGYVRSELGVHELRRIDSRAATQPVLARRIAFSRALAERADRARRAEELRPC